MARFLLDLQISNYSSKGSVAVESDSNFIFTRNLIEGLVDKGHECGLIIDHRWFMPSDFLKKITPLFAKYRGTVTDRFFVDYDFMIAVNQFKPDVLWSNDPCRVGSYRAEYDGILISYNHWVDNFVHPVTEEKKTYWFRQYESLAKANFLGFNSQFGIHSFFQGIKQNPIKDMAKIFAMAPPLNAALLKKTLDKTIKQSKPTLVYNHRLSSAPQYKGATDRLSIILDELDRRLGVDNYQILVSNPSKKEHKLLDRKNVKNIYTPNYAEYLDWVSSAWMQLTLFQYPGQWSMSMAEAMCLGLPMIYPDHSGYHEMVNNLSNYMHPDHSEYTIQHIMNYLTNPVSVHFTRAEYYTNLWSKERAADQLLEMLNGSI